METHSTKNVDKISELPDSLCHHILSFLSAADAGMTIFLSRRWKSLWYSSHVYDFDEDYFASKTRNYLTPSKFLMLMNDTLIRRQRYFSYLSIDKLRLCMNMFSQCNRIAWHWILFALKSNVKELDIINVEKARHTVPYSLSDTIFMAKSITKLEIAHLCVKEISVFVSLLSLQELVLTNSTICTSTVEQIICGCPIVKRIYLGSLDGESLDEIKKIKIPKETLKELIVCRCTDMKLFVDYAPNLERFAYEGVGRGQNELWISSMRNLRSMTLMRAHVTDSMAENHVLQCPRLEELVLVHCSTVDRLVIASAKLGKFALVGSAVLKIKGSQNFRNFIME